MRIALSGGHLTPVYSLAEVATLKGDQLLLIGSAGHDSIESTELKKLGVNYLKIYPVKFDRHHRLLSLIRLPLIFISIFQSLISLKKFKADTVITFGSFNAVPVGFAAKILGIPLIIHEQTRTAGLANRILAPLASKCALSYEDSKPYFPKSKSTIIGNPIRSIFWTPPNLTPFHLPTTKPILYITGGNQGSNFILEKILSILPELVKTYQVIIQYGRSRLLSDISVPSTVVAKSWFDSDQTAYFMHHADLIISRGGANTTAEIMIAGKPSIIIPLPRASQNEQLKNAQVIEVNQAGLILNQRQLTTDSLLQALNQIEANYDSYRHHALGLKSQQNPKAAQLLYDLALNSYPKK